MRRTITVAGGKRRNAVIVDPTTSAADVLKELRLPASKGLVVFNGGTTTLSDVDLRRLRPVLDRLLSLVDEDGLTLLTGATDAGVFSVLGEVAKSRPGKWRMVGVAPLKLVSLDGAQTPLDPERTPLEPNHTDFVLVDTARWGGETCMMLDLAREIARRRPSVAVLASGGDITRTELLGHIRDGRAIVVLAGSGRLADEIAEAQRSEGSETDPVLNEIVHRGQLAVLDIEDASAPGRIASTVRTLLEEGRQRRRRQRPALVRRLPRLRWSAPDATRNLVPLEEQKRYPALASDFAYLNDHLLDVFRLCDDEALRQQNTFYLANLVAIVGSLVATVLGIIQVAAVPGRFWFSLAETVLAAALGGGLLATTARAAQRGYFTSRLKAERLRSEYFLFLARHAPYAEDATRRQRLIQRVTEIQTTTMAGPEQ